MVLSPRIWLLLEMEMSSFSVCKFVSHAFFSHKISFPQPGEQTMTLKDYVEIIKVRFHSVACYV